ncbi:GNAT family N-acetyltransferase [Candidatus Marithrix sp. Canyon 246]|uniref:GNAT family N-acetyltransferase n=1 Tax=Candidatus Marithrix sp. Canyon 246 TaxID=1827136 RepID=UPI000849F0D3|nr:GNAT family protein [Candidatus Marithrix sp. Canyon 246]
MILFNQGNSLEIRQIQPKDASILTEAYKNPEFMSLYGSNMTPLTEEQLYERQNYSIEDLGFIEYLIIHKQHGAIGIATLTEYAAIHKRAQFMIGLFETEHRSIGYGTEATLLVLDLAFNAYGLHKVFAYAYEYNNFSHKNMLKFGFEHEGILKDHHFLIERQQFINLYVDAMTETRFRSYEKISRYSKRLIGRDVTQKPMKLSPKKISSNIQKKFINSLHF